MGSEPTSPNSASLRRFLNPRSIAVIGASDRPGSLGLRTMRNLEGFSGRLYPVSRRLSRIGRHECHGAMADLPEVPDCAILAVPAAAVEDELRACAERGVGGCVVFASGYAELEAPEGAARQARLRAIAAKKGMRLLGPNTTGFASFASGAHAGFAEFPGGLLDGQAGIGLVSQSGALGLALAQAATHGTGLSHVLTCGNSADIDVADLVEFLCDEPDARAIAVTFEGVSSPERLIAAVSKANRRAKPVVICRIGTTSSGAAAVRWHTGTDPNHDYPWDRALDDMGAVIVSRPETLIETTVFLAKTEGFSCPALPRVAILSSSGGSGILAADCATLMGLPLADPGPRTRALLAKELPGFASARNPCDATAQATSDPPMLTRCAEILLSDRAVDALVIPWGKAWDSGQFAALSALASVAGKPICLVWMSQWLEGPGALQVEAEPRLSLFRSMESCMAALGSWPKARRSLGS
ncbi:MAG: CoA-binding protein [Pararhodobacter sp.]|nr:CoA-binding protein [Pararhodobacter sp.]